MWSTTLINLAVLTCMLTSLGYVEAGPWVHNPPTAQAEKPSNEYLLADTEGDQVQIPELDEDGDYIEQEIIPITSTPKEKSWMSNNDTEVDSDCGRGTICAQVVKDDDGCEVLIVVGYKPDQDSDHADDTYSVDTEQTSRTIRGTDVCKVDTDAMALDPDDCNESRLTAYCDVWDSGGTQAGGDGIMPTSIVLSVRSDEDLSKRMNS